MGQDANPLPTKINNSRPRILGSVYSRFDRVDSSIAVLKHALLATHDETLESIHHILIVDIPGPDPPTLPHIWLFPDKACDVCRHSDACSLAFGRQTLTAPSPKFSCGDPGAGAVPACRGLETKGKRPRFLTRSLDLGKYFLEKGFLFSHTNTSIHLCAYAYVLVIRVLLVALLALARLSALVAVDGAHRRGEVARLRNRRRVPRSTRLDL